MKFVHLIAVALLCALAFTVSGHSEDRSVSLFPPCEQIENVCLFKPSVVIDGCVDLFNCNVPTAKGRMETVNLFEIPLLHLPADRNTFVSLAKPEKPQRKRIWCYCPKSCLPCQGMANLIGKGNDELEVIFVKGDETKFPEHIRACAEQDGWPVQHWAAPSGKGAMHNGVKSMNELLDLVNTEPKAQVKPRTKHSSYPISAFVQGR